MKKIYQLILLSFLIFSCEKNPSPNSTQVKLSLPEKTFDYRKLPDNFEQLNGTHQLNKILNGENQFEQGDKNKNPALTNEGATLGRVLFYDKSLSLNNTIACGSCHIQANGFADPVALSSGFENLKTTRNSSSISNAAISDALFWDSRAPSVKAMTLNPIQNHIEMGIEDLNYLEKKLAGISYYPELFKKAYGSSQVTKEKISDALAQFVCALVSSESKNDLVDPRLSSSQNIQLNALEKLGKEVFNSSKTNCSVCHGGNNMVSNGYENSTAGSLRGTANIGLDAFDKDKGFIKGTVKIPSLRNVGVSGPYMHDGRFNTLMEVVEHYNSGVQNNANLDNRLRTNNGSPIRMGLSDIEKEALVAFLNTLTDEKFLKDERFSDPFVR